eukprot:jgi/Botrbrau1/11204/Bobra.0214s0028.1
MAVILILRKYISLFCFHAPGVMPDTLRNTATYQVSPLFVETELKYPPLSIVFLGKLPNASRLVVSITSDTNSTVDRCILCAHGVIRSWKHS